RTRPWPRITSPVAASAPPAPPPWSAAPAARTSRAWGNRSGRAGGSRRESGCGRTWRPGTRRSTAIPARPATFCRRSGRGGGDPGGGNGEVGGLLEPAELDKLPPDERKDCIALSKEIDGLLTRAGGTATKP